MPIILNHSNIEIQYNTGSNYIIDTVKSDLYRKNEIYENIVRNNIQTAPVTPMTYIDNGNVYAVESYTYLSWSTANTTDYTRVFTKNTTCDILVVGGGGGGARRMAGGGGAGALIFYPNYTFASGSYNIKVGKGGNGSSVSGNINTDLSNINAKRGQNGSDSEIILQGNTLFRSKGGGGGLGGNTSYTNPSPQTALAGGSGGGNGGKDNAHGGLLATDNIVISNIVPVLYNTYNRDVSTPVYNSLFCYGNEGGIGGGDNPWYGSGGGGAGQRGRDVDTINTIATANDMIGVGGNGLCEVNINGTIYNFAKIFGNNINYIKGELSGGNIYYAGGGGGGSANFNDNTSPYYNSGGLGGGGRSGTSTVLPQNGIEGTGGGGGGDGLDVYGGGNGGSGIVIIRYLLGTIPTNNILATEPIVNPSVLVADAYYPRTPSTTSPSWADNGYNVIAKVSDPILGTEYVYKIFNNIITSQDHYHSQLIYNGAGNTYTGTTRFKTFAGIAIGVDFGRSIYPKRMRIAPRPLQSGYTGSTFINGAPNAFKIFASDDASCWNDNNHSSWTQIHDQTTSLTYTNEQYTIVNFTANLPKYRYYTMVVLSTIGSYSGGYMMISEWNIGGDEKMVFELDGGTHKKLVFDYPKYGAISEMTGMTNWVKIKHKPASWTTVYSGNTFNGSSISGTYTLGNSSDNSNEWAVPFNEPEVKYYLFVMHISQLNPDYKDLWMVFEASEMKKASTFTTNYNYQSVYVHAYKTTMKPLGFAAKNSTNYQGPTYDQVIYNRVGASNPDPVISMYYIYDDGNWNVNISTNLYVEWDLGYDLPAVEGGVYVKYDNDVPLVYPANSSYTLNFPVPTLTDINNHSNIILQGTYNINVNNSNILITPKPSTFINTINNYNIERMYPPIRNFTAATTTVSGQVYGNGTYVVSFSATFGNGLDPWTCFNTSIAAGGHWTDRYTAGTFNSTSFIVSGYLGDWVKIQLPVAIKLTRFEFLMRNEGVQALRDRAPKDFKIYGSNDNITWIELVNKIDAVYNASFKYEQTTPEITNTYSYYALVVNKLFSTGTVLNFNEWYIYGQELLASPLSIRYNIINPIQDPVGAQWTYNSSNTNVYHMGNVGIGTTSPEYSLDVRGFIFASGGGYTQTGSENWVVQSDRRIKENIVKASYEKCLDNVKKIELYNFNFKDNCVNTNDKNQLGFIAQEVQEVYPKAVEVGRMTLDNDQGINDLLTLNTTQIKYTLYGAVKKLIERVENIESRVEQIYNMAISSNIKSSSSNISITVIAPTNPLT